MIVALLDRVFLGNENPFFFFLKTTVIALMVEVVVQTATGPLNRSFKPSEKNICSCDRPVGFINLLEKVRKIFSLGWLIAVPHSMTGLSS